jgi:EpsD family peptidyl-prolyl cis-trans isomerase
MAHVPSLLRAGFALAALAICAGCGGRPGDAVAARVNGKDVEASRVHGALAAGEAPSRALERVIDQELLVQAALESRLDRDPQVVQALDSARRQVLAQAYVERSVAGVGDGNPGEVKEFYERNPALFARRRIYRFQEAAVQGPTEKLKSLREQVASAGGMDEVAGWLKSRKLAYTLASATKAAEQVPLNVLTRLAEMSDGQLAAFSTPAGLSIVHLVQSQEAVLSEAQAAPVIEKYLASRRRLQIAEEAVAGLRARAAVEYRDEYRPGRQAARSGFSARVQTVQ